MPVSQAEAAKMKRLAQEGKTIANINREDFPDYEYYDIYDVVYAGGQMSARGTKKMITNRLKSLSTATQQQQQTIIDDIGGLVEHMYNNVKANQQTMERIRKALGE